MRSSVWIAVLALVAGTASAQSYVRPTPAALPADTLRLTRREAIAQALLANPLLDIAREQTAQVRAQRIEGISIPEPALSISWDSLPRPFRLGAASSR